MVLCPMNRPSITPPVGSWTIAGGVSGVVDRGRLPGVGHLVAQVEQAAAAGRGHALDAHPAALHQAGCGDHLGKRMGGFLVDDAGARRERQQRRRAPVQRRSAAPSARTSRGLRSAMRPVLTARLGLYGHHWTSMKVSMPPPSGA